jgi:S-(hydroxymethyl)glutathione dehydrogenase/alcohol dehydrogenase
MNGRIALDAMVTHVLPHAEVNKAFDLMHGGHSIRTVLTY